MKVGIHKLSNEAYHASEGLSSTEIKEIIKSPLHYQAYLNSEREQTKEMLLGSLVHDLILEPESFDANYAVGKFNVRRGKEYEALVEKNPDKKVISEDELSEAHKIVEAFNEERRKNPELENLMQGMKETAFYWKCQKTGLLLKCKPDILGQGFVADIKTARDASFDGFQKAIVDLKYFVSAAHYLEGVTETIRQMGDQALIEKLPEYFVFIVIETKAPYAIALYYLDSAGINLGRTLIDKALKRYSKCLETGEYSAFPRKVVEIQLPNYAMYKFNQMGDE